MLASWSPVVVGRHVGGKRGSEADSRSKSDFTGCAATPEALKPKLEALVWALFRGRSSKVVGVLIKRDSRTGLRKRTVAVAIANL